MTYYLYLLFGFLVGFLSYSTYFSAKVSKGLSMGMLYDLVYTDPINDELLLYTFYNLFWCRVSLMIAWCLTLGFGGVVYAIFKV